MTPALRPRPTCGRRASRPRAERGSVLIIVLWVAFGLVSLALYFAHAMSMELRSADNRGAAIEARQAIDGAARYVTNLLTLSEDPGRLPEAWTYQCDAVPVGRATFWLLGRDLTDTARDRPTFGLVDEGAKLNLNAAPADVLEWLPRMTSELAGAIVDWRDSDSDISEDGGAEDETYLRLNPAYHCKNSPFESVEELRLVQGMTLEILYGEDTNQNGLLDPNENDGDLSPPPDNRDGRLDPGLVEFLTIHSQTPTNNADGSARMNLAAGSIDQQELASFFEENFGVERANAILRNVGDVTSGFASVLEFLVRSQVTTDEALVIETNLVVTGGPLGQAHVNVNTASEAVLACIPGIGPEVAPDLIARRQSNTPDTTSLAWVAEVLTQEQATQAGPYLTGQSYQFSADIVAVGHHGRGFTRVRYVCDTQTGVPRLVSRRDLTPLGWPLGRDLRRSILLADHAP